MKKIMIGAALWLLTMLSAFSQTKNITVTGRVMEDTKEPAIQATVQLLSLPDSAQTAGVASSAQGYFTSSKQIHIDLQRIAIAWYKYDY